MAEITNYKVASSPHKKDTSSTRKIMLDVLIALVPCVVCGTVYFGFYSLMLVAICAVTCFLSEQAYNLIRKKPFTFDLSAIVTGVILGLNLPPRAPWYIPVIGGIFAIIIVKMLFGGLGKNFANPAATARVFLLLAYSSLMTQYIGANVADNVLSSDIVTAPTYLTNGISAFRNSIFGIDGYWGNILQLLFGTVGGSIGETCKLAIIAGGIYLTVRRVIDWRIPVVYIFTAATMTFICYQSASQILLQILSGGLLFGAVFMATDYATSPKWRYNRILYAIGLGIITVLIRRFGAYPEGTSLAILIMNLIVPVLDRFIVPVRFGQITKQGKAKPQIMKWGMRGLCLVMAMVLLIGVPLQLPMDFTEVRLNAGGVYYYIEEVGKNVSGEYKFTVHGEAPITKNYSQELKYQIRIDKTGTKVVSITPIIQSTKGYTAELSFFEGKTYDQIVAIESLKTDSNTSATKTNVKLRDMILECFAAYDSNFTKYTKVSYWGTEIKSVERKGDLYRFTIEGIADLTEFNYQQALAYAITIDAASGKVKYITTLRESTYGYTLEKSIFVGKTSEEISAMKEDSIAADITTGATVTNVAGRDMILKCFDVLGEVSNG